MLRFRPGTTVEHAIRPNGLVEVSPSAELGTGARVFLIDPDRLPGVPPWRTFIEDATADPLPDLRSSLNGAVIFMERAGRLWAFTFGTGHVFVNEERTEPRLGLKTVLNIVQPDRLRAVGSRVHEDVVIRTERQVSRRSTREAFTIDDTRDILGAVTGEPADRTLWGQEVTGATAFSLSIPAEPADLAGLLDRIEIAHASSTYKTSFAFVDFIEPVRDQETLDRLDEDLIDAVAGRRQSNVYLAPPEPILYDDVAGFLFFRERSGAEHAELDLQDYRASVNPSTLTLDQLHSHEVRLISASTGHEHRSWSIYKCLVYETLVDGDSYLLSEGEWFKLDRDFVARVDREIGLIPSATLGLPPANRGEQEGAYNARAAAAADLALMDRKMVRVGGTTIEIADLISDAGHLIHVKRKTQSATLSHLFSQGRISGEALKGDLDVRRRAFEILTAAGRREAAIMTDPFSTTGKVIVYAVIAQNAAELPLKLPFFSRLNLWQASRFLKSTLDYQVVFVGIPVA